MSWEPANIGLHGGMPKALETKVIHFFERALRGPMLESDAIGGNEHAGSVVAEPAMNVKLFTRTLPNERKELNEFLVFGGRPAAGVNIDQANAMLFGAPFFRGDCSLPFAAKIHNRSYADLFQLLYASFVWL